MSIRAHYNQEGFYLVRQLFAAEEVERVRREAKDVFAIQLRTQGLLADDASDQAFEKSLVRLFNENYEAFLGAAKLTQHLISLHRLALDERIVQVLKTELQIDFPTICVKPIIYFNSRHLAK